MAVLVNHITGPDQMPGFRPQRGRARRTVNFYDTNPTTLPHLDYDTVAALPGRSSVAVAVDHLNSIAATTPACAAAPPALSL
jgi:hypothetical protein